MHTSSSSHAVLVVLGWLSLMVVSALGWFATGRGLAFRLGLGDVASAVGFLAAAAVVVVLAGWARGDAEARALERLRCPTCAAPLETRHEHAVASMSGRQVWACASCGFGKVAPLTCAGCAT